MLAHLLNSESQTGFTLKVNGVHYGKKTHTESNLPNSLFLPELLDKTQNSFYCWIKLNKTVQDTNTHTHSKTVNLLQATINSFMRFSYRKSLSYSSDFKTANMIWWEISSSCFRFESPEQSFFCSLLMEEIFWSKTARVYGRWHIDNVEFCVSKHAYDY